MWLKQNQRWFKIKEKEFKTLQNITRYVIEGYFNEKSKMMLQDLEEEQSEFVEEIAKHGETKPMLNGLFIKMNFHNEWNLKDTIDALMYQMIGKEVYERILDELPKGGTE